MLCVRPRGSLCWQACRAAALPTRTAQLPSAPLHRGLLARTLFLPVARAAAACIHHTKSVPPPTAAAGPGRRAPAAADAAHRGRQPCRCRRCRPPARLLQRDRLRQPLQGQEVRAKQAVRRQQSGQSRLSLTARVCPSRELATLPACMWPRWLLCVAGPSPSFVSCKHESAVYPALANLLPVLIATCTRAQPREHKNARTFPSVVCKLHLTIAEPRPLLLFDTSDID